MVTTDAPRLPATITLTATHIARGHPGNALTCPIALCLMELTGKIWAITPSGCYYRQAPVDERSTWICAAKLKPASEQWREAYDATPYEDRTSVKPCTLTLEVLSG